MKVCFTIIFLSLLFVSPARATDTIPAAYIPSSEDTTIYHTPDTTFDSTALELNTYKHNPLFIDLIYMGKSIDIAREKPNYQELYFGEKAYSLSEPVEMLTVEEPLSALWSLRSGARDYIARQNILLYTTTIEELPIVTWNRNEILGSLRDELFLKVNEPTFNISGISLIKGNKINPWTSRLHTSLQFSQNAVSKNWHKGGYNNLSVLGILTGHLNYDNYKKVRWENFLEWRSGLTALDVIPDSTWIITPNEDLFRIISNFGLKATGNFYYSSKADFQTQFFNSPKALNSTELKARFLTPIKFTLGVGMKYQRKALTIELSPVTFQYIYLHDTIPTAKGENIDPEIFGIENGKNEKKDWGSELNVVLSNYSPVPELKLSSNFRFFTNYTYIIIDWEIIAEFQINRFLSTRLLLNPRFDNSVILKEGEKHTIQMKQMLTFGLSFRLY